MFLNYFMKVMKIILIAITEYNTIDYEYKNVAFIVYVKIQEEVYDDVIPVELWVRQSKIPGPLAPTKIEINSINRMLVDKGVALPIKK